MDNRDFSQTGEASIRLWAKEEDVNLWLAFEKADSAILERGWYAKFRPRDRDLNIHISPDYDKFLLDYESRSIEMPQGLFKGVTEKGQAALVVGAIAAYYRHDYERGMFDKSRLGAMMTAGGVPFLLVSYHVIKNNHDHGVFGAVLGAALAFIGGLFATAAAINYDVTEKVEACLADKYMLDNDFFVLGVVKDRDAVIEAVESEARFNGEEKPFKRIEAIKKEASRHPEKYSDPENSPVKAV